MNYDFWLILMAACTPVVLGMLLRNRSALPICYFAMLPFPVGVFGEAASGNVSGADLLAGVALIIVVLGRPRFRIGQVGLSMAAYLSVALISSALAGEMREGVLGLGRMMLVTAVPFLWFANGNYSLALFRRLLAAYCIAAAALGACTLFTFLTGGIESAMFTFGIHKNSLGPIFGTGVAICFTAIVTRSIEPRHWGIAMVTTMLCSIGLLLCLSRGGWAGTAASLIVVMLITRRTTPAIITAMFIAPVMLLLWSHLPSNAMNYATDVSMNSYVMRARFNAQDEALRVFEEHPVIGVGVSLRRRIEPHNAFVLTLGETGLTGLATFSLMLGCGIYAFWRVLRQFEPRSIQWRLALAGLAVFVVFHVQTLVDVYWRRGIGAMSWACVGMAVAIAYRNNRLPLRGTRRTTRLVPATPLATERGAVGIS